MPTIVTVTKKRGGAVTSVSPPAKKRKTGLDEHSIVLPGASHGRVLRNRVVPDTNTEIKNPKVKSIKVKSTKVKNTKPAPKNTKVAAPVSIIIPASSNNEDMEDGEVSSALTTVSTSPFENWEAKRASSRNASLTQDSSTSNPYDSADSPTDEQGREADSQNEDWEQLNDITEQPEQDDADDEVETEVGDGVPKPAPNFGKSPCDCDETETGDGSAELSNFSPIEEDLDDDLVEVDENGDNTMVVASVKFATNALTVGSSVAASGHEKTTAPVSVQTDEETESGSEGEIANDDDSEASDDEPAEEVAENPDLPASGEDPSSSDGSSPSTDSSEEPDSDPSDTSESERADSVEWYFLPAIRQTARSMAGIHAIAGDPYRYTKQSLAPHVTALQMLLEDIPPIFWNDAITDNDRAKRQKHVERVEHQMLFLCGCYGGVLSRWNLIYLRKACM